MRCNMEVTGGYRGDGGGGCGGKNCEGCSARSPLYMHGGEMEQIGGKRKKEEKEKGRGEGLVCIWAGKSGDVCAWVNGEREKKLSCWNWKIEKKKRIFDRACVNIKKKQQRDWKREWG